MQPPAGSAPITLTATRHKSTGNTSYQVESDFSQARMLASWGSSDYTVSASGDKYLITAGGKVYTFTPGSVGIGVPLPTVVAEFEVLPPEPGPRPVATEDEVFRVLCSAGIAFDSTRFYGNPSISYNTLSIYTPDEEVPDDPYKVELWIDYSSGEIEGPVAAGAMLPCSYPGTYGEPLPASAVWSFGDLLTYPSVPVIG